MFIRIIVVKRAMVPIGVHSNPHSDPQAVNTDAQPLSITQA
jgi:hypothetical protein